MRNERAPRGEGRGEGRRERGERNGEGRRERGERGGERRPADAAASDAQAPETEVIAAEGQEANVTQEGGAPSENNGERRERRSRDRYGRDRRERAGEPRQDNQGEEAQSTLNADSAAAPSAEATAEDRPAPRSYFERAQQTAAAPVAAESAPAAPASGAAQIPAK